MAQSHSADKKYFIQTFFPTKDNKKNERISWFHCFYDCLRTACSGLACIYITHHIAGFPSSTSLAFVNPYWVWYHTNIRRSSIFLFHSHKTTSVWSSPTFLSHQVTHHPSALQTTLGVTLPCELFTHMSQLTSSKFNPRRILFYSHFHFHSHFHFYLLFTFHIFSIQMYLIFIKKMKLAKIKRLLF